MMFSQALERLKETGCFNLVDEALNTPALRKIDQVILTHDFSPQIYLSHVNLTDGWIVSENDQHLLVGAVTGQERTATWNDKVTDIYLYHLFTQPPHALSSHYFTSTKIRHVNSTQISLEGSLLSLFYASYQWEVIRLDQVVTSYRGVESYLSDYFWDHFFQYLNEAIRGLKVLSLQGVPVDPQRLLPLLKNNKQLTELTCELTPHRDDLKLLLQGIADHPSLRKLDLGTTPLDQRGYDVLTAFLDKHYRLESIYCSFPTDVSLRGRHQAMMQRLSQQPLERFKQEQLNQRKLLSLAEQALASGDNEQLTLIFSQPALRHHETESAYSGWPEVYQAHRHYLDKDRSLVQLRLSEQLEKDPAKSVGYYLLEKAFESKDATSLHRLLEAGANLLEQSGSQSLISRLFRNGRREPWKAIVVAHLQKEWEVLVPQVVRLKPFVAINERLKGIKAHLNTYLNTLMARIQSPLRFLQLLSGVLFRLKDRKAEWEQALDYLVYVIRVGTEKPEITSAMVNSMYQFVDLLIHDALIAKRGLQGRSELNDGLECLGNDLKIALFQWMNELKEEELRTKFQADDADKIKQLKEHEGKLKAQEKEHKAQAKKQKAKAKEREAQVKERERKLRKEMEEMKAKAKEQEAKAKEQEERINQLSELIMHHGLFPSPAQQGLENLPQEKLAGETRASFSQR